MTDNKREYRRDHAIKGLVPEKPKMEKSNVKKKSNDEKENK